MNGKSRARRTVPAVLGLVVLFGLGIGCRTVVDQALRPVRFVRDLLPSPREPTAPLGSVREARKAIQGAIKAHRGERLWRRHEGIELEVVWKKYVQGGGPLEYPARIMMTLGPPPRIHIRYTKVNQVFGLGDAGPWATMRGSPIRDQQAIKRANYTTRLMAFFLSAPFVLNEKTVLIRGASPIQWGGKIFDGVKVGFRDNSWLWQDDSIIFWIDRASGLLDRCFFISTGEGSDFGPAPPHYIWIQWTNYQPLDGVPLARNWAFILADAQGVQKEKLFDLEITRAVANRSFMPVLFREPIVQPNIQRLPEVGAGSPTPAVVPKLTP